MKRLNNNIKISIIIVMMFITVLFVIGVSYSFFTAQVKNNSIKDSIDVNSGKLEIIYSQGNKIESNMILPGWVSDGKHYYDPVYSGINTGDVYHYVSRSIDDLVDCKNTSTVENINIGQCSDSINVPLHSDGITYPVEITVNNGESNKVDSNYILKLNVLTNSFGEIDRENLKVTVKKDGTGEVIWSGTLASEGSQVILSNAETISVTNSDGNKYKIYLTYINVDTVQNDSSDDSNKSVVATIEVVGATNTETGWVDFSNNRIAFSPSDGVDYTESPNNGL